MKLLLNARDILTGIPKGTKEDENDLKESILEEFEDEDTRIAFGEFEFGVTDAEVIKSAANGWNKKILADLMDKINGIVSNPAAFTLDSDASFHLFEAARLADNRFSIWGDAGVMWGGELYGMNYGTIIPESLLKEVLEKPEEWVLVGLIPY